MSALIDGNGDVAGLRREIYAKEAVSREDLAGLLRRCDDSPELSRLVADVATDLLVHQADPPRYVSQADADWLVGELRGSQVAYAVKIAALLDVLHYSVSAPPSLEAYCVGEIEAAIVEGRNGHAKGIVTPQDTQALRQAVFAPVEGSALHVTRASAEALFRIAHASKNGENDPAFDDFFAKAVGNYLMGVAFHWTPSAAEEREKERWLDAKPQSFGAFLGSMFSSVGSLDIRSLDDVEEVIDAQRNEADAREMAAASEIDAAETRWLVAHLSRQGDLTSAEKALLKFLKQEAPSLPEPLCARLGEAA
ncbi:MAG TPA: hypothetical protein VEH76_10850 [Methylocystis sp.]|nr:hypothetical protein [Methylocystis sp.]